MKRKNNNYTTIPFKITPVGHLETEVLIDGIITHFLIDTGASNTVIDIDFAKTHLLEFSSIEMQGGGIGTSQMELFHKQVATFTIGNLIIKSFDLYATDFTHIKESLAKKGIDEPSTGVIGADILIKYKAKINYKKKKMYLKK